MSSPPAPLPAPPPVAPAPALQLRAGQRRLLRLVDEYRLTAFLARRQYGKSTCSAAIALRSERLQTFNSDTGKPLPAVNDDDWAQLFEAQRLEFRYYHSDTIYSRTKVVALRDDTVGETGDLICDEIGRVKNFRETWEAIEPIISSDPAFRCLFLTTPPPDDTHFSFEMLAPPIGTDFPVHPDGNLYRSEMGIQVLRLDAFDARADGVLVYDSEKGEPVEPAEHRRRSHDKDAWDRNYGVRFIIGGTGAINLMLLDHAMRKGVDQCRFYQIENDDDLAAAAHWLRTKCGPGQIGVGWDLATTEKNESNPSSFVVAETIGGEVALRAIVNWKTCDPEIARHRARTLLEAIAERPVGGKPRRLAIDATNERYFAADTRKALRGLCPVDLVIMSEAIQVPGAEKMTIKQHLAGQLISLAEDNRLWLPPERYIKVDFRLVKRTRGTYDNTLGPNGEHGDTFDSAKLAVRALTHRGPAGAEGVLTGANPGPQYQPRPALRLTRRL